jgi:predicted ATP-dependent endonuclease of OLD family
MKLDKVIIENFRGYKDKTEFVVEETLTGLIGKNDAGKSTVLEALEIFFNSEQVKIESNDKNVFSSNDDIKISCVFSSLPENIVIDSASQTTLNEEFLLNSDGKLEIEKLFDSSNKKPSETIFIVANHPNNNGLSDLHLVKQAELKKRIKERKIDESSIQDMRSNVYLRQALYASEPLQLSLTKIPVNKEDAKAIWESLEKYLPIYALFKSDRGSNDQDSEVQDPMKLAVTQALAEVQEELEQIKQKVKEKAVDVAQRTLEKLSEMDANLADDLIPDFSKEPEWKNLFKLNLASEQGIPLNKRGSGVRRLILLNFFRAEAERKSKNEQTQHIIYAIEEPETAQHPSNQEMLVKALLQLADRPTCQVLLTTHVPALASLLPLKSVRFIDKNIEEHKINVFHGSEETYRKVVISLGILPDKSLATANAFIMVEGYCDVIFLNHLTQSLKDAGYINSSLKEKNIVPIISGGCGNLKHWVNLDIIKQLNRPWAVFLDSDNDGSHNNPEYTKKIAEIEKYRNDGIYCHLTKKREAENYLCPDVIKAKKGVDVVFTDYCHVKSIVNKAATYIAKDKVLENFWRLMTAEDILKNDIYIDEDGKSKNELLEVAKVLIALSEIEE